MLILLGGIALSGGIALVSWRGHLPRRYLWLLLVGAAIGMVWELAFTFSAIGYPILPGGAPNPGAQDLSELPVAAILPILAVVSIWDGALFLAGLVLARLVRGPQIERRFDLPALLVMLIWGQVQSFAVESYAIHTGMWAYAPSPLNPALLGVGQAQLTLLPQLVWMIGYLAFYGAVLTISARADKAPKNPLKPPQEP